MPEKTWVHAERRAVPRVVFARVLRDAVCALGDAGVGWGLIGGIACTIWGSGRETRDIDVMVAYDDVATVLEVLLGCGFETDQTEPAWLAKAYRDGVVVDVISRVGDIPFDAQMASHVVVTQYMDASVQVVAAEDLVTMKAHCHTIKIPEYGSHSVPADLNYDRHWRDALAIVAVTPLDADYLLERSHLAPHAVLSLLAYAQAVGIVLSEGPCAALARRLYAPRLDVGGTPTPRPLRPSRGRAWAPEHDDAKG
jgi:hypothetical protein